LSRRNHAKRTLVIGDIHGCYEELQDLLERAGLSDDDAVIALGDIVDRGPDSAKTLEFFLNRPEASSLMGNHERKHYRCLRGELEPALGQRITRLQLGEAAYARGCRFFESLPTYIELPEAILVHGMVEPGLPLPEQKDTVLLATMSGEDYMKRTCSRPWYELYDGDKPLICAHHDYSGTGQPFVVDKVHCIDTNCCRGGSLTGIVLPEFRLVSVRSRGSYWSRAQRAFRDLRRPDLDEADPMDMTVDALRLLSGVTPGHAWFPSLDAAAREDMHRVLARAEDNLRSLHGAIAKEHDAIESGVSSQVSAGNLDERARTRLFHEHCRASRVVAFLHRYHKGKLSARDLKISLPTPRAILDAVRQLETTPADLPVQVSSQIALT
jgi:predicted phosphodiesterase